MEIVIALFVLVGGSIAFSAWRKNKSSGSSPAAAGIDDSEAGRSLRSCLACGHEGEMKTWIKHYTPPKLILIAGFVLGYLPGLVFLVFYWGKYKCPQCGAVGKNQQATAP